MKATRAAMFALLISGVCAGVGCSFYHPWRDDGRGGYHEVQLGDRRWKIRSALPAYVGLPPDCYRPPEGRSYQQMVDFAWRRAAEVCLAEGCAFFIVEEQFEDTREEYRRVGIESRAVPGQPALLMGRSEKSVEPAISLVIRCYTERPPNAHAVDAAARLAEASNSSP